MILEIFDSRNTSTRQNRNCSVDDMRITAEIVSKKQEWPVILSDGVGGFEKYEGGEKTEWSTEGLREDENLK